MSDERPKLQRPVRQTLGRILGYVAPYRTRVAAVVVLMLITSAAVLVAPAIVRQAINEGLSGESVPGEQVHEELRQQLAEIEQRMQ